MNTVPTFNKYSRRLKALTFGLSQPALLKKTLRDAIQFLYAEGHFQNAIILKKSLDELVDINQPITLQNYHVREGNVTCYELLVLATIVANYKPHNLLEIGTFDGNTTLQMALNCPPNATVHTIDLPPHQLETNQPILDEDLKFVKDVEKQKRKYLGSSIEHKVIQHLGDSTAYNFQKFTSKGHIDFCFIDGGHSYECVKSDTENVLKILSPHAVVVWHDFSPNCLGNYHYLCELSQKLPLIHIANTQLVVFFS